MLDNNPVKIGILGNNSVKIRIFGNNSVKIRIWVMIYMGNQNFLNNSITIRILVFSMKCRILINTSFNIMEYSMISTELYHLFKNIRIDHRFGR